MSNTEFDSWRSAFEVHLYSRRPVDATFAGRYEYNRYLTDVSHAGLEKTLDEIRNLLIRSEELNPDELDRFRRIDYDLIRGFLKIQRWERESGYFYHINSVTYTGEAVFSMLSLFLSDFRPAAEKKDDLEARLALLPAFFESARENLSGSPADWTARATEECIGGINFLTDGLEALRRDEGLEIDERLANEALNAFRNFKGYLETELPVMPVEAASCGEEVFRCILSCAHGMELDPLDYAEYAEGVIAECDRRLAEEARGFGSSSPEEVLASLADYHPNIEDYEASYRRLWDKSYELNRREALVSWPDFPIEYCPIPAWARSVQPHVYFLFYRCPPRYAQPAVYHYHITPIERSMPPGQQEQLLRSNNTFVIKTNHVLHHGGIGHHVQNQHAMSSESLTGRVSLTDGPARLLMLCSGTLCEGWACYITSLAGEQGFLSPKEQYAEIASRRRMAARAVVDVRLHCGVYNLDEATRYYMEKAKMPEASARSEAVKNSLFPGGAVMYLYGTKKITELREDMKRRQGDSFDLKSFHDEFLSYGGIPVARIAAEMKRSR